MEGGRKEWGEERLYKSKKKTVQIKNKKHNTVAWVQFSARELLQKTKNKQTNK